MGVKFSCLIFDRNKFSFNEIKVKKRHETLVVIRIFNKVIKKIIRSHQEGLSGLRVVLV
jgi:hypothetical protein